MSHLESESSLPFRGDSIVPAGGRFLDIRGLSQCLGIALATAYSDLSRAPWKLPPGYKLPGRRKMLWDREEVFDWVKRFPDRNVAPLTQLHEPAPMRRGRPRKQAPARSWKAAVAEPHLQGRG